MMNELNSNPPYLYPILSTAEKVSDKIYSTLQSNHYCGRRLNATHQMGCQSELGGNFGVVWLVDVDYDIDHILKAGPTPPYIAILGRQYFTRKNLLSFKEHPDRVNGVVFLDGDHENSKSRTIAFSPEDTCPNRYSGLYANHSKYNNCKQNSWIKESDISGLLYDDIPFPVFLINDKKSVDEIQSCFKTHNLVTSSRSEKPSVKTQATYPLCGLQLDSFMMAAQDSDLCLNSHYFVDELLQSNGRRCDSVDNHNIFAYYKPAFGPLKPTNTTNIVRPNIAAPQSIVMLVTKLSSLSMFSDISPGADSTISSIVTLLTIAEALGRVKNSSAVQESTRNIAFAFLDSEPFDYTGSSKMIFNMLDNTFPNNYLIKRQENETDAMINTNLESIEYMINLDQMANYPNADAIHFHSEPDDINRSKIQRVFDIFEKVSVDEKVKFQREDDKLPLPPAPVQEFIKSSREQKYGPDKQLTGIVLSNYGKTYNNLFYHSTYDDSHNIYQTSKEKLVEHIAKVSRLTARGLFELTFKVDKSDEITVDKNLIEELLQCFLIDADCHLFTRATTAGQKLPSGPIQTYKDPTKRSDDMNGVITAHLLAYFLGDKMTDVNLTKCIESNQGSLIYNYEYINGKDEPVRDGSSGVCIRSQVAMLSAQSPAYSFTPEGGLQIDRKYPAWTVSLNSIRNPVRLYLKPSPVAQWATLFLGIVITVASFIIVRELRASISKINSNSDIAHAATLT